MGIAGDGWFACTGVDGFNAKVLSLKFTRFWTNSKSVQQYYTKTAPRGDYHLHLKDEEFDEYRRWTPFADAWDVRPPPPAPPTAALQARVQPAVGRICKSSNILLIAGVVPCATGCAVVVQGTAADRSRSDSCLAC